MLSKKEIIYKHENVDEKVMKNYPNGYPYIDKAMDEHAQQMSIGFAEFIATPFNKIKWLKSVQKWTNSNDELYTTEQLYQLYLNQLNAK